jgi:hypothetical protein
MRCTNTDELNGKRTKLTLQNLGSLLLFICTLSSVCTEVNGQPLVAPEASAAFPAESSQKPIDPYLTTRDFEVNLTGYTQMRYQRIEDDPKVAGFIGRNDGFGLSNARLNLEVKKEALSTFFSIEGARDRRQPNNRAEGDVRTLMLDAYFTYEFSPMLSVQFGRFKPAYDANELESTAGLLFADRALESRGVLGVEGLNIAGLSLPRQQGAQLNGVIVFDQKKNTRLKYFLSFVNGNVAEQPLNDNDQLAIVGRIELNLRVNRKVSMKFGGGAYLNEITEGEMPDLISEERVGYTADAALKLYGLRLRGQWMRQDSTFVDVPQEPSRVAEGYHAIVGFDLGQLSPALKGVMPAYRLATYDPTKEAESDNQTLAAGLDADTVTHHSVGINLFMNKMKAIKEPLKLQINYTIAQEEEARLANNDRFDILLQMSF